MIVSAAIVSQSGEVYLADFLPEVVKKDIQNQADSFLFAINRDGNSVELPYFETSYFQCTHTHIYIHIHIYINNDDNNNINNNNLDSPESM